MSVAYAFRYHLSLKAGDTVMLFSGNCLDFPVIALATQACSLICCPANAMFQEAEVYAHRFTFRLVLNLELANRISQIQDSGASFLLCGEAQFPTARIACLYTGLPEPLVIERYTRQQSIWDLVDPHLQLQPPPLTADEARSMVAFLVYSSGTSGKPKVKVMFNIKSMIAHCVSIYRVPNCKYLRQKVMQFIFETL